MASVEVVTVFCASVCVAPVGVAAVWVVDRPVARVTVTRVGLGLLRGRVAGERVQTELQGLRYR